MAPDVNYQVRLELILFEIFGGWGSISGPKGDWCILLVQGQVSIVDFVRERISGVVFVFSPG